MCRYIIISSYIESEVYDVTDRWSHFIRVINNCIHLLTQCRSKTTGCWLLYVIYFRLFILHNHQGLHNKVKIGSSWNCYKLDENSNSAKHFRIKSKQFFFSFIKQQFYDWLLLPWYFFFKVLNKKIVYIKNNNTKQIREN